MEDAKVAKQIEDLLYQALETELGGVEVYKTALRCAVNEDLKEEWEKYLEQTHNPCSVVLLGWPAWLSGRALASHARGQWFESTSGHHFLQFGSALISSLRHTLLRQMA